MGVLFSAFDVAYFDVAFDGERYFFYCNKAGIEAVEKDVGNGNSLEYKVEVECPFLKKWKVYLARYAAVYLNISEVGTNIVGAQ